MVGKLFKLLFTVIVACVIFSIASIAGTINDDRKAKKQESEPEEQQMAEIKEVKSPFPPYEGGVLELQINYETQIIGKDINIAVVSNLPDSYDLTAELTNIEDVKQRLGYSGVSPTALTTEQQNEINTQTYSKKEKNFVTNGVCNFLFTDPPTGTLDLKITSPITKLQSTSVQELLGEKGVNLQGAYVVYLEEVNDKSINFTASFIIQEDEAPPIEGDDSANE